MNNVKYLVFKNDKGKLEKRRILTIYQKKNSIKDYVIFYKDNSVTIKDFGVASYDADTDFKNINFNLTQDELDYAKKVIEVISKGNF